MANKSEREYEFAIDIIAEQFRHIADELDAARRQETKLQHLRIRADRAVVQAARLVIDCVNRGVLDSPTLKETIALFVSGRIELKGTREKPVGTMRITPDGKWHIRLEVPASAGRSKVDALTVTDEEAHRIWVMALQYLSATKPLAFKADAGAFDWKTYKTDTRGRPLGRDGKLLRYVNTESIEEKTGRRKSRYQLAGEPVTTTDDYDSADWLAHLRNQVGDWADACGLLAGLVAEAADDPMRWIDGDSILQKSYVGSKGQLSKLANKYPGIRRPATEADRVRLGKERIRFVYDARRFYELSGEARNE